MTPIDKVYVVVVRNDRPRELGDIKKYGYIDETAARAKFNEEVDKLRKEFEEEDYRTFEYDGYFNIYSYFNSEYTSNVSLDIIKIFN